LDSVAITGGGRKALYLRCLVHVVVLRASPGCGCPTCGLPEVLAQVRLVGEATSKRNVSQRRIGRQHVLSGQF
jgi:hypothetical protein